MAIWIAPFATAALYALSGRGSGWSLLAWIALAPLTAVALRSPLSRAGVLGLITGAVTAAAMSPWLPGMIRGYFHTDSLLTLGLASLTWIVSGGLPFALFAFWLSWGARRGNLSPWLAGATFSIIELGRTRTPLGNPSGLLGNSQADAPLVAGIADLIGVFGIGALLATSAAILASGISTAFRGRRLRAETAIFALVVGAVLLYGAWKLEADPSSYAGPVRVALIQGAIARDGRWKREFAAPNLERYVELSERLRDVDVIAWPELAMEFYPQFEREHAPNLRRVTQHGAVLLAGGLGVVGSGTSARRTNAVFAIDGDRFLARYDKLRLVPLAESNGPLEWMGAEAGDFAPGSDASPSPFRTRFGRIGIVTCSESMFPGSVRDQVLAGAEWLVNPANDDWFGSEAAARQQLSSVVMRAIESGRWIARPTTTGFTAIVDPRGRVAAQAPFGVPYALQGMVERRQDLTVYVRFGDWIVGLGAIALLIDGARRLRR